MLGYHFDEEINAIRGSNWVYILTLSLETDEILNDNLCQCLVNIAFLKQLQK